MTELILSVAVAEVAVAAPAAVEAACNMWSRSCTFERVCVFLRPILQHQQ